MLPLSLAIVCNVFPAEQQARALGIWAGISAVALAIGPLAGGVLVELDWRLIFWITAAVAGSTWVLAVLCAAGAALTWAFVRDPSDGPRGRHAASSAGRRRVTHY